MHITDNEAAMRLADRENQFARRRRNNHRLDLLIVVALIATALREIARFL